MSYPPTAAGVTGEAPGALALGGSESLLIPQFTPCDACPSEEGQQGPPTPLVSVGCAAGLHLPSQLQQFLGQLPSHPAPSLRDVWGCSEPGAAPSTSPC